VAAPRLEAAALDRARQVLDEIVPGAVTAIDDSPPEGALLIDEQHLVDACRALRDDPRTGYTMPLFSSALDWLEREPRFDLVYQLRSLTQNTTLRLKVPLADGVSGDLPHAPSLSAVWPGMEWHERETYDLLGVVFDGHPDLRRILMPDDWEGHPLRKDYVSFGEPVLFTDRASFAPDSAMSRGAPD